MAKFTPKGSTYRVEVAPQWGEEQWVQVPKTISRHPNLSTEAVGAVVRLVDNDSEFRFNQAFLQKKLKWGRDKTLGVIKELELAGFVDRRRDRNEKGQLEGDTIYTLYPTARQSAIDSAQRRYRKRVSAGKHQNPENPVPGSEQPKRDVPAGQAQDTGFQGAGAEQPKRDVPAGKNLRTGFQGVGAEQPKRDVPAGKNLRTGNPTQIEPNERNLNTHTPASPVTDSSSGVESDGGCVSIDEIKTTTDRVVRTIPVSSRQFVGATGRARIAASIRGCLERGHSSDVIVAEADTATREGTTHPVNLICKVLSELQAIDPGDAVHQVTPEIPEAPERRLCPDCGEMIERTICVACVSERKAAVVGSVR